MKVYIVFMKDEWIMSIHDYWDDIFIASSMEKVIEFLNKCVDDHNSGVTLFSEIKVDVEFVDEYFSKESKCVGIKKVHQWLE